MYAESRHVSALSQAADEGAPVFQPESPDGNFLPFFALSLGILLTLAWGLFLAWAIVATLVHLFA
jgi:hypothetical protein